MSKEKFELDNYTAEAIHHMLNFIEDASNDGMVVAVYEEGKEAKKMRQKS
jgi:hypothetical protein